MSSSNTSNISNITYLNGSNEVYLYPIIDAYFDHPVLEKTKNDNALSISIYMCKISTLLAGADQRYLVVTVDMDSRPVGSRISLSELSWKSFQTRTIPQYLTCPKHSYLPKSDQPYLIPVDLVKRYEDHTDYSLDGYPSLTVTLLHKHKNLYEYSEKGVLASALETFRCVIVI